MKFHRVGLFCLCVCVRYYSAAPPQPAAGNEWPLDIRPDGSYRFAYSTGDTGRHYHTATASPDNTVTGVFGYRDPGTGRDLQTKYSAGKRGFRANGPHIARRMDLSQNKIPYHPPVSPDSPLYNPTYSTYHDPNEDPTYSFEFHTPTHSRKEDSDYKGDVNGRYSYVDDVGLRHVVEYEAGSKIGFHVKTAHPESNPLGAGVFFAGPPANRKSSKPLRGHTAIQRGKDGSYSFTAVGPDQRRTEQSDATGHVKGFYTYLDDKGVQRTTQYIAGPNIGYKIVSSHTNDRYPVLPYPPPYPPFLPASEDKDGGDIFGTSPGVAGTGTKPPTGSGQKPTGDDSKDPWISTGLTGSTSTTTTPIPGSPNYGGNEDDLFGPPTEGGTMADDNDEEYLTDQGYIYDVPGKDDGSFLQSSSTTSNIPYGNCCKLAPTRPAHRSKSQSRPSRNHEQFVGFPSGVPIRAHVQSLDLKSFGSRLPDPGAAIDLQVPPKARRGGESDKPDYWGIKVRRHSRVGDQEEIQDTQIAPRSSRQINTDVRQADTLNPRSVRHSEVNGNAEENQETQNQRKSSQSVNGNSGIVQSKENHDTRNLPTSSNSEVHGNAGAKQSDESRNVQNLQTSSHLEVYGNAGAVQPEENQDIPNLKISSRSERHLKLLRHLGARQEDETQDKGNQEAYSRTLRHLKEYENSGTGESEKNEGTQSSQTSDSSRHSQAEDPKVNQDIEILKISTEPTIHSELYRNIQAGEPKENQEIHRREPEENQEIHILETTSESSRHSDVHRRSVEEQSWKNKDSQKQRLGLKIY